MVIKVSVVIPLLNPDTNLALCLDSVLSQSFSDFEVICVYNSLENKTQNLLEHYQKFDSRIKLIHSDSPNYSGIKNCGLENSNGEYIIFLKPSDRLSSIALSVLIENANKYNSQVILFDFAWGKTSGNKEVNTVTSIKEFKNFSSGKTFSAQNIGSLAYKLIPLTAWAKLYRTDFLREKNIAFSEDTFYSDIPFWTKVFALAERLNYLPQALYFWNNVKDSDYVLNNELVLTLAKAYIEAKNILENSGLWKNFSSSLCDLMMLDFYQKYSVIRADLKEKYFNEIKNIDIPIDYKLYEGNTYSDIERNCAQWYQSLKNLGYSTFITSGITGGLYE